MTATSLPSLDAPPGRVELLLAIRDVATSTARIDLDTDLVPAEVEHLAATLSTLLGRALALLAALQRHDDQRDDASIPGIDVIDSDAWVDTDPAARVAPRLSDVCFAGTLELRRVLRELTSTSSEEDRTAAIETAHRKLRRAVRAVLETARTNGEDVLGGQHQGQHQVSDLATGLAVRKLYAVFRRSLRRSTAETPEAVLVAVRYAGGALATIVASPDYGDLRASDRTVLRRLRERALWWARNDRGVRSGLQLLEDVFTCGDLLRGINRRQELLAHDAATISACRNGPEEDFASWRARLDELRGMDDDLDGLLDQLDAAAKDNVAIGTAVSALLTRLQGLHG